MDGGNGTDRNPAQGSDLGALTTKALAKDDGTYKIKGQKILSPMVIMI